MEFIPGEQAINTDHGLSINSVDRPQEDSQPPVETQATQRFTSWRFPATATAPVPPPAAQKPASRSTLNGGRIKVIDFAYEQTLPPVPTVPLPIPSPTLLHAPPSKRRREVSPGLANVVKKSRPSQSEPIVVEHFGSSRRKAAQTRRAAAKGLVGRRSSTSRSGVMGKATSRDRLSSFTLTLPTTPMTITEPPWPEFSSPDTEPDTEPDDEPMTPITSIFLLDQLLLSPKESHEAEELATHRFFGQAAALDSEHEFMFPGSIPGMNADEQGISPIDQDHHLSPRSELPAY